MNGSGEAIRVAVRDVVETSRRRVALLRPAEEAQALWEAGEALKLLAKTVCERRNPSGHFRLATEGLKAAMREGV